MAILRSHFDTGFSFPRIAFAAVPCCQVDWKEPLFRYLLAFHACVLALAWLTRARFGAQVALMLGIAACVLGAERLNGALRQHWRAVAGQNYFDARGVFMSVVFSVPLLGVLAGQLFFALYGASTLLVKVKRAELAAKQKKRGGGGGDGDGDDGDAADAPAAKPSRKRKGKKKRA